MRNTGTAYLLWAASFFGVSGLHRFYCGHVVMGILYFLTCGFLFIGTIIDAFIMSDLVHEANVAEWEKYGGPRPGGHYGPSPPIAQAGGAAANRVLYCPHCGKPMQVPAHTFGRQYACPSCRAVLQVPA